MTLTLDQKRISRTCQADPGRRGTGLGPRVDSARHTSISSCVL